MFYYGCWAFRCSIFFAGFVFHYYSLASLISITFTIQFLYVVFLRIINVVVQLAIASNQPLNMSHLSLNTFRRLWCARRVWKFFSKFMFSSILTWIYVLAPGIRCASFYLCCVRLHKKLFLLLLFPPSLHPGRQLQDSSPLSRWNEILLECLWGSRTRNVYRMESFFFVLGSESIENGGECHTDTPDGRWSALRIITEY